MVKKSNLKKENDFLKRFSWNFVKEEYEKSWNYVKESKNFIYSVILIFFSFFLIGFFVPAPDSIADPISVFIKGLLEQIKGMSQGELIEFIFLNNLQSSFIGMIFGAVLGIFSIFVTVSNGYLLGFVASISVGSEGLSILWRIFPHGIFELPAVFISLGLGFKLGMFIFQEKKFYSFKKYFWNSLRVFLFIVVPLLVIAGIIEGSLIFYAN